MAIGIFQHGFFWIFERLTFKFPITYTPKAVLQMPHYSFILDDQMPPAQGNSKETILLFLTINARLSSALQADSAERT